jgi:hypothetical protein
VSADAPLVVSGRDWGDPLAELRGRRPLRGVALRRDEIEPPALSPQHDSIDVIVPAGGRGTRLDEKTTIVYDVSMGVYVLEREVVDLIPSGEQFDFPDVVHVLLERDLPVAAYRSSDFWLDIGRREDYELAQECFGELRGELLPEEGGV